jgi:hypothetical protein
MEQVGGKRPNNDPSFVTLNTNVSNTNSPNAFATFDANVNKYDAI